MRITSVTLPSMGSDPNRLRKCIIPKDHIQPSLSKTNRKKAERANIDIVCEELTHPELL